MLVFRLELRDVAWFLWTTNLDQNWEFSTSCSGALSERKMKIKGKFGPCNRNHSLFNGEQLMPLALSCNYYTAFEGTDMLII